MSSSDNYEYECNQIFYSGLLLNNKYVILKEIGSGNSARVFLAYSIKKAKYYAIKVQDFECYKDGVREISIIKSINDYCNENNIKNSYCVTMLKFFIFEPGYGEKYVCSVYELYAGSIITLLNKGKYKYGLPIDTVKNITRQLLKALILLHQELSIVHTDIKPENILFKGKHPDHSEIIRVFEKSNFATKVEHLRSKYQSTNDQYLVELTDLARHCCAELEELDFDIINEEEFNPDDFDDDPDEFYDDDCSFGSYHSDDDNENFQPINKRRQSVDDLIEHLRNTEIVNIYEVGGYDFVTVLNNREISKDKVELISDEYVTNCQVAVTDFGCSYYHEKRTKDEVQPRIYRAPEVILDLPYGYPCDIWSVACVVYELLTGYALFEPSENQLTKDIHHLFLMESFLGPMPNNMKKVSKRRKFLFDKKRDFHIKGSDNIKHFPIQKLLVNQHLFSEQEATEITEFLLCGLTYDPRSRSTAEQLLNHKWLR